MPTFEENGQSEVSSPQNVSPAQSEHLCSAGSVRSTVLKPYVSRGIDEHFSKLSARQMALAQAQTMAAIDPDELEAILSPECKALDTATIDPLKEFNRKRRKLQHHERLADFVHVPTPISELVDANHGKSRSSPVIDQPKETPPNAAPFTPIAPSQKRKGDSGNGSCTSPPKRIYTRKRRNWTDLETDDLKEGIALCGVGRWKAILEHPKLHFQKGRTHVDLKDKFRTLYPPHHSEKWTKQSAKVPKDPSKNFPSHRPTRRYAVGSHKPYRGWTDEEDAELDNGFERYGFQWHLIAQDESLQFNQRSANQIRDRFRRRYPDQYEQPPPPPVPKSQRKKDKKKKEDPDRSTAKALARENDRYPKQSPDQSVLGTSDHEGIERSQGSKQVARDSVLTEVTNTPMFLGVLLGGDGDNDESAMKATSTALKNDHAKLAPLQWEDMTPLPFDFG